MRPKRRNLRVAVNRLTRLEGSQLYDRKSRKLISDPHIIISIYLTPTLSEGIRDFFLDRVIL